MANLKANLLLSQLAIIDMQVKLAPAMSADALKSVVKNCGILAQAAQILAVSTVVLSLIHI